ncbi:hypothetical protein BFJ70_g7957 [Fusarium oxysporum]|uniref:3CxxC-type domain-containing protein n=1 Tax=Fusarium oxysporum f. sp. cepae TaxID=396571 RepID=A0A3L6MZR5_FUSOX|nr:hypothetical protein FOWG_15862 [Fusarium oxysporum f. sp. lycopersici MN25]RKK09979.1 hypothetical protein BFJ65_g15282 [Fusarium oxysporum f. sp. cepae]RKL35101.1 hypothetical protein BFJ70_g7957 [Fusarium oxysporum]EWZ80229.1 hypothetical protein FOWG_15862 [Fusarium oxysporum f. sp. lycopersici MN25]RKK33837.1 hypothetical protein BFJ67_g14077 [Fusarium oxysporum f. sp. cepae]
MSGKRGKKPPRSWSMFPDLHDQVADKLEEDQLDYTFFEKDEDLGAIRTYDTNIIGRFVCHNNNCDSRGWKSMVVAITIREYSRNRYNVRVYHQRCIECNHLSKPKLKEETYVDRVTYRIKKWNGVEVEIPKYSDKSKAPHEEDHCEGCKNGHCKRGNQKNEGNMYFA